MLNPNNIFQPLEQPKTYTTDEKMGILYELLTSLAIKVNEIETVLTRNIWLFPTSKQDGGYRFGPPQNTPGLNFTNKDK